MFHENLSLKRFNGMSDILNKVHPYINYEEKCLDEEVKRGLGSINLQQYDTDEYVHLKEVIKELIKKERLTQYTQEENQKD